MLLRPLRRGLVAVFVLFAFLLQGTFALAGTTGTLSGTATDATSNAPLAGATVTAASPSQVATTKTDASGHFAFLNLTPDTYTVSLEFNGYESSATSGITVVADNTRVLTLTASKTLKTIGTVRTRAAGNLVRPGTTADVYSINAVQQSKESAAGGGGTQNSAFSALSTVPGVSVAPGQSGYIGAGATLSIRGGDYDQIGYEIDGVPVNRAFDNYPSGPTSSLGQQELQVYTGAPPASASSQGISGYVNQVIKSGTSPGFFLVDAGIGGPAFYHKLSAELGGETDNKRFSYYVGLGGYNQDFRYIDQFNGQGVSQQYGIPYAAPCGSAAGTTPTTVPSCYTGGGLTPGGFPLFSANLFANSTVADRDSDVNLHYYFPHKDGSRDDIQGLYQVNSILSYAYGSTIDEGGVNYLNNTGVGVPFYIDGYALNLPTGGFLPANYQSLTSKYAFPGAPSHVADVGAPIDLGEQDGYTNNQAIAKLQYTKSLGSNAYFRVYGYTYYSDWLQTGPQCTYIPANCGTSADYELSAHTRGVDFELGDQLNAQNLLQLGGSFTTSNVTRDNNTQMLNGLYGPTDVNTRTAIGVVVNSNAPTNGICYTTAGVATPCFSSATGLNGAAGYATIGQAVTGSVPAITAATCGSGPCQYLVIGNGQYATYNQVKPNFYGASLSDEFRPTSKLTINAGIRLDDYQYQGADTSGGNARAFFYSAYNQEMCESTTTQLIASKTGALGLASPAAACPAGYEAVNFQNPSGAVTETYPVYQPRLGFTYTVDPNTVFRATYGRYAQPPNSAFEQYNFLQSEAPSTLYGTYGFQQYGFTTPNHPIPPAASNNYDFSIEHAFPDGISIKATPFLRKTQNQIEQFFLNRATNFVSGLNVGNQTSEGFEFELDKGDFSREGLAAKLSFAYTHSYINYNTLSNGTTVLTPVVNAINAYNALTKAGGGSACYTEATATAAGVPAACGPGTVANPYYNAPEQSLSAYTSGSSYVPYDTIPAGIGLDATQIGYPYVASLVLNEKLNRFAITPIVQLFAGQRYGDPLATNGVDPTACAGVLAGSATTDPRYKYGAAGGSPFDATTCGQLAGGIPNQLTGSFDGIGAFVAPSQLLLNMQLSYEVTKNFSIVANVANLVNTCFGGSKEPWNVAGACGYTYPNGGLTGAIGNTYNPGQAIQPIGANAYSPFWSQQPISIFVDANIKL
jgi:hypothetical protein